MTTFSQLAATTLNRSPLTPPTMVFAIADSYTAPTTGTTIQVVLGTAGYIPPFAK